MKILIDINHPAHVHYFKNFIKIAKNEGHICIVTNRNSKIIHELLEHNNIDHFTRSKRPLKNSFLNSIFYLFKMIRFIYRISTKEKVDFYLGFASAPCSIVSFLRRKPCVLLDDTEHNKLNQLIYKAFCKNIITPFYFKKKLIKNQIIIHAFIEHLYLHQKYFKAKRVIPEKKSALLRFVAYDAKHDSNIKNQITNDQKLKLVDFLEKKGYSVLLSDESETKKSLFLNYYINIKANDIHHLIENVDLFISEGATMACEAGLLHTEYFYINPLQVGNIDQQVLDYPFAHKGSLDDVFNFLQKNKSCENEDINHRIKTEPMINPTNFLTWLIFNFPQNKKKVAGRFIDKNFIEKNAKRDK